MFYMSLLTLLINLMHPYKIKVFVSLKKKKKNLNAPKLLNNSIYCCIYIRDATIPFFQIRSDPENSEYRPIPIRAQLFYYYFLFF